MKISPALCLLFASAISFFPGGAFAGDEPSVEFPHAIAVEMGATEFAPGDSIAITAVTGTQETIAPKGTYCVVGTYTLASAAQAKLGLSVTVANSGPTRGDPRGTVQVVKGSGQFRLIKTVTDDGYLHLAFFPAAGGESFGNIYFGQGKWVLRKMWSHSGSRHAASGSNQAIFDFLGEPVAPPADMDAAYSRRGLFTAVTLAAKNTGVDLGTLTIDDSEFPFMIGVVCSKSDFVKLLAEINTMTGYHNSGSVSSDTCHAFSIVPSTAYPAELTERIHRRWGVRAEMLYEKITAAQSGM